MQEKRRRQEERRTTEAEGGGHTKSKKGKSGKGGKGKTGTGKDDLVDCQCSLQLRGLPYSATIEDIRTFLGEFASQLVEENPINRELNRDGRPTGFARVQFVSAEAARQCREGTHLRSLQDRYVEVFLYNDRSRARHAAAPATKGDKNRGGKGSTDRRGAREERGGRHAGGPLRGI